MKLRTMSLFAAVATAALAVLSPSGAGIAAEDWPTRPVTLALVSPAGGATDRGLRPLAKLMQEEVGTPIAVTDMSGASGNLPTSCASTARSPSKPRAS
jgi:tripartite-type tricarboxylate transporter receptor subunit TctC